MEIIFQNNNRIFLSVDYNVQFKKAIGITDFSDIVVAQVFKSIRESTNAIEIVKKENNKKGFKDKNEGTKKKTKILVLKNNYILTLEKFYEDFRKQ